jgi:hypothetical protein
VRRPRETLLELATIISSAVPDDQLVRDAGFRKVDLEAVEGHKICRRSMSMAVDEKS